MCPSADRAIAESSTAFDEELQYLIEFADHRSAALFLQRTAGQQMMAATILNDVSHPAAGPQLHPKVHRRRAGLAWC